MARYQAFPRLKPFDRNKVFKVRRPVKLAGREFKDGDMLDKSLLTTRTLRQLYEQRFVEAIEEVDGNACPKFLEMPTEQIRAWLKKREVILRPRWKRDKLIQVANETWSKENPDGVAA